MDLIVVVKTFADSNSTEMKMCYKGDNSCKLNKLMFTDKYYKPEVSIN